MDLFDSDEEDNVNKGIDFKHHIYTSFSSPSEEDYYISEMQVFMTDYYNTRSITFNKNDFIQEFFKSHSINDVYSFLSSTQNYGCPELSKDDIFVKNPFFYIPTGDTNLKTFSSCFSIEMFFLLLERSTYPENEEIKEQICSKAMSYMQSDYGISVSINHLIKSTFNYSDETFNQLMSTILNFSISNKETIETKDVVNNLFYFNSATNFIEQIKPLSSSQQSYIMANIYVNDLNKSRFKTILNYFKDNKLEVLYNNNSENFCYFEERLNLLLKPCIMPDDNLLIKDYDLIALSKCLKEKPDLIIQNKTFLSSFILSSTLSKNLSELYMDIIKNPYLEQAITLNSTQFDTDGKTTLWEKSINKNPDFLLLYTQNQKEILSNILTSTNKKKHRL